MDIGIYCHIKKLLSNLAPGKKIKSEKLELLTPLLDKGIPSSVLKDVFISIISSGQKEMFSFLLGKDQLKKMDSKDVDAVVNLVVACESVLGKIDTDDDGLSILIGDNESFFLDELLFYNIFDKYNIEEKQKMFESVLGLQQIEKAELFFKYQLGVDINALNKQGKTAFDMIIQSYTNHHVIATSFNKNKIVNQDYLFINNEAIPFLKKYNFNFNKENYEAHTAIMQSVKCDMGNTIKNIIDAGGKLEEKSSIGISAMDLYKMKDKKSFSKETVSAIESFVLGGRYDVEKKNKAKIKKKRL